MSPIIDFFTASALALSKRFVEMGSGELLLYGGLILSGLIGLLLIARAWRDSHGPGPMGAVSREWRADQRGKRALE